jgi:branched-subunit amino acid aminotransferase/4-amino-4-deoxychorismate lyase
MVTGQAYYNGKWIDAATLAVPVEDLGFVLGATVVERLRTFAGKPFRLDEHMARFRRSLEVVGWETAPLVDELAAAIAEFAVRHKGQIATGDDWSIAAFVTPGLTPDAAAPTRCVHGGPLPFGDFAAKFDEGVHLALVDIRQTPANCWPPSLKCRSRMHYYLADREAARRFPGARALLLDQAGHVGEASTANVIAYDADRGLVYPKLDGVLPGISQQVLFELAGKLGIACTEEDLLPPQFAAADEIFLASTSVCLLPVTKLDGRNVGAAQPGPAYRKLLAAWSDHVGLDVAAQAKQFANRAQK